MVPWVVPLRAILFQFLLLLVTIATEAFCLQKVLKISPKASVEYGTVINLISAVTGWILFFLGEGLISDRQRRFVIGLIFFNQWQPILNGLIIIAIITFLVTFWLKLKTLNFFWFLWSSSPRNSSDKLRKLNPNWKKNLGNTQALLISHCLSSLVVVVIILIQFIKLP